MLRTPCFKADFDQSCYLKGHVFHFLAIYFRALRVYERVFFNTSVQKVHKRVWNAPP